MANLKNLPINQKIDFEMADGTVVRLTVAWILLLQVRSKSKSDYERYSKLLLRGAGDDILAMLTILYVAYLCGYIDDNGSVEGSMSEEEFVSLCPNDLGLIGETINKLLDPKGRRVSAALS